ncbi:MAG: hypothetical protein FWH55_12515 [Oscillospiraceae bacterium]|nr:hypothetical protein [Oscillospiraceae bacterium]
MDGMLFFMILVFGLLIVSISIFLIVRDNRKGTELLQIAETEKGELLSIIEDAELMVDELNNFSDYVITQIEKKNTEVDQQLTILDEKLKRAVETQVRLDISGTPVDPVAQVNSVAQADPVAQINSVAQADPVAQINSVAQADPVAQVNSDMHIAQAGAYKELSANDGDKPIRYKDKAVYRIKRRNKSVSNDEKSVINIKVLNKEEAVVKSVQRPAVLTVNDKKCASVLKYSEDGMSETEIAKALNIGKGEVELILELKSYYEKY